MNVTVTMSTKLPSILEKQVIFATAVALTRTARDAQPAVEGQLGRSFTLRGNWFKRSNRFGVHFKPATKKNLAAYIGTDADWLTLHEQEGGGIKTPQGDFIAIPTKNVRRTKAQAIQRAQRPRALIGKRDFIVETKNGNKVLFQRTGKGKRGNVKAMYILVRRGRIKHRSTILDPVAKIVADRFGPNFDVALMQAIRTAR